MSFAYKIWSSAIKNASGEYPSALFLRLSCAYIKNCATFAFVG